MRKINKLVIHCSDSPDDRDVDRKDIDAWHKERGWDGIGYHYVIKRDGVVEIGRPESVQGAHTRGHNRGSLGVCMIGREVFSEEQYKALTILIKDLTARYRGLYVAGHYEYDEHKTCPNFKVEEYLMDNGLLEDFK